MENFEKCTVAMLGGPCSQHVTGKTSRQNQPQSVIIEGRLTLIVIWIPFGLSVEYFLKISPESTDLLHTCIGFKMKLNDLAI